MAEEKEYAVIRLSEQNGYCHLENDVMTGMTLMDYVVDEITVTAAWILEKARQLAEQLEWYHKCENKAYGFVTPYAVIIGRSGEIAFLDTEDPGNEELTKRMMMKKVRSLFVPEGHTLAQLVTQEDDFFGYGKCIEFMCDSCKLEEPFAAGQRKALISVAGKCVKDDGNNGNLRSAIRTLQAVSEKEKRVVKGSVPNKKRILVLNVLCVFMGIVIFVFAMLTKELYGKQIVYAAEFQEETVKMQELAAEIEKNRATIEELKKQMEEELAEKRQVLETALEDVQNQQLEIAASEDIRKLEMGLSYLANKDYIHSANYLNEMTYSNRREIYRQIRRYLEKGGIEIEEAALAARLEELKEELISEQHDDMYIYWIPVMRAEYQLKSIDASGGVVKSGILLEQQKAWGDGPGASERELEIRKMMFKTYERKGMEAEAEAENQRIEELKVVIAQELGDLAL